MKLSNQTFRQHPAREAKLAELIEEAKNELTVCFYDEPIDLHERLRNDITAVVARSFHAARQIEPAVEEGAARFLDCLVPSAERLARGDVEQTLIEALDKHHIVEVSGELGVGKTVLLAALAAQKSWVFVTGTSPSQIAVRIANQLRAKIGMPAAIVQSYEAAIAAVREAWQRSPRTVVAVDACPSAKLIDEIAAAMGALSADYRLAFSLSTPAEAFGFHRFRVPSLREDEVGELWLRRFGSRPTVVDLTRLMELSKGVPLYLRYVRTPADMEIEDSTLETIELRRFQVLPPLARDIVTYVCLSDRPLTLDELVSLTGERRLLTAIEQASVLTVETSDGFSPVHQHLQTTLRVQLERYPARHAYYAAALGKRLVESGDFSAAFLVFDRAGLADAVRIIARASFEAGQQGDFRTLIRILTRRVELLEPRGASRQFCSMIVALAHAEDAAGEVEAAKDHWQQSKTIAEELGDVGLRLQIRAAYASRDALSVASPAALEELAVMRDELLTARESWLAGNVALDLSTIFIRIGREKEAAENARIAADRFASMGDTYGLDVARRNLAAALSQIPERQEDARKLLEEFTQADTSRSKRLQAFKCNLLFMAARRRGDNDTARALAQEALAIGEELKDVWVVITNTINLANVERDRGRATEAIRLYNRAAQIAQASGFRTTEAIASRHAAHVHNQINEFRLAKNFAEHAAALLRDTAATVELSIALEERAKAESGLGDLLGAARGYLDAAKVLIEADDKDRRTRLISRAAAEYFELADRREYFNDLGKFYGVSEGDLDSTALAVVENLSGELPSRGIFGALNVHFRFLFRDAPAAISRRLIRIIAKRILDGCAQNSRRSLAFIPLLAAAPPGALDLHMLVEVGDDLHNALRTLSFKPSGDLALNYVISLELGRPVVLSISQIDDAAETAALSTIIALFFLGFEREIRSDALSGERPERSEVNVSVIALSEAIAAKIPVALDRDQMFGLSRPANFDEGLPTLAIFRDGLLGTWEKDEYVNGLIGLLASVLMEVTFQLLKAEVDSDTLRRNIIRIVRNLL